tara:strand:+ start:133 stop:402 length:270 start_codon:yes stop_codon:yes gene_type:complete
VIDSFQECDKAAGTLEKGSAILYYSEYSPSHCYIFAEDTVEFNTNYESTGSCSTFEKCICMDSGRVPRLDDAEHVLKKVSHLFVSQKQN